MNKKCKTCGLEKELAEFYPNPHCRDKHKSICNVCHKARSIAWAAANRERTNKNKRAWNSKNKTKVNAWAANWRKVNKGKAAAAFKKWAAENNDKLNVIRSRRRAAKLKAYPAWADHEAIGMIYSAAEVIRTTGFNVHVDHVFPLQGAIVSGLHVHNNLQIISAFENISKHNKIPEERMFP